MPTLSGTDLFKQSTVLGMTHTQARISLFLGGQEIFNCSLIMITENVWEEVSTTKPRLMNRTAKATLDLAISSEENSGIWNGMSNDQSANRGKFGNRL